MQEAPAADMIYNDLASRGCKPFGKSPDQLNNVRLRAFKTCKLKVETLVRTLVLFVACGEFFFEVGDRAVVGFEQYKQVVDQVRRLVDECIAVAVDSLDDGLDSLFADLLSDLVDPAREESGRVGTFGHLFVPVADDALKVTYEPFGFGNGSAPAGFAAGVACRAVRDDADQECVGIAVGRYGDYFEPVAALFALGPEALSAAAEEGDAPSRQTFFV